MRCPYFLEWDKENRSGAGCVCITDGVQRLQSGRMLSNIQIQHYCKNNCEACPDFKTARGRGVMGVLPNQKSSGGFGTLVVIGIIVAVVTKYLGMW